MTALAEARATSAAGAPPRSSPRPLPPRHPPPVPRWQPAEFPPHDIAQGQPAPGLAQAVPPCGAWVLHDCCPSRLGWHVACPACLDGRVLLEPDPDDPFEYRLRPNTCTAGCDPYRVVRWWAFREGDAALWWDWLDRQRARNRAARRILR